MPPLGASEGPEDLSSSQQGTHLCSRPTHGW